MRPRSIHGKGRERDVSIKLCAHQARRYGHEDGAEVISVRISANSDRVKVLAEPRSDIAVEGSARIRIDGTLTTVDQVHSRLFVRVPQGADVIIGTTSAPIKIEGLVGDVALVSDSGNIDVSSAGSVDVRTTSGRVEVGLTEGECRIRSVDGRVQVSGSGAADIATQSGRIRLKGVHGPVHAHCVSGRIQIEMASAHDVDAETVSGRVEISLPEGTRVHRSSDPRSNRPDGTDCVVRANSVSGRVDVVTR